MEEGHDSKAEQGEFYLTINTPLGMHYQVHHSDLLDKLLVEFEDLFIKPTTLPLTRMFDHAINLKPNAKPINIRSYRYPPIQKTEIEKMVREMLQQSIIRSSQSPFTSPVLLVKKKRWIMEFLCGLSPT